MPVLETQNFGRLSYSTDSEIEFPRGLPGFESRRRFVAVEIPENDPLVFLQSLEDPTLCFTTLPVLAVDPAYRLQVNDEDLELVGLSRQSQPQIGREVLCLTVLAIRETGPTANLLAPLVVNLSNLKGVQAVGPEGSYSHQHELLAQEAAPC